MKPRNNYGYESQESAKNTLFLQETYAAKPQELVGFI